MSAKDNKRASATFQMFKDMETKTEFQKVKMAGFLRELHKLATEEAKSKLMSSMDQLPPAGGRRKSAAFGDGTMSVMGLDLEELKPEEALGNCTREENWILEVLWRWHKRQSKSCPKKRQSWI